jgi:cyclopropane fatty-acyl-phospholipid synthase-like methyltransferase
MSIKTILNNSAIYSLFCFMTGFNYSKFVDLYIRPVKNDTILDIGCGPADILRYLPEVNYIGFDISQSYIDAAVRRFKDRGAFYCKMLTTDAISGVDADIVVAMGVLHHLDDQGCVDLFTLAHNSLKKNGRLITMDGCYVEGQPWLARYIISKDRGQFVRQQQQYLELAKRVFSDVTANVCNDLIRIPYTHIIMQCRK